ncbi:hypothetical protein P9441_12695, partial [Bacillus pumilus]|nr:hypothetical protein [Bacillus pumilus]
RNMRFSVEKTPRILCQSCALVLTLPRLQRFSITLKRRQRAKIKIILALCQQSEKPAYAGFFALATKKK